MSWGQAIQPNDWLPLLAAPFVGSLVGVLIRRLPSSRPVALARSVCETCGHALGPAELVPLLSFVWLRGRCRHCRAPIAHFHVKVELAALLLAALVIGLEPEPAALWPDCGLAWTLLALAWIDWERNRLPDALTLPLCVAGLVVTQWLTPWQTLDHAIGAVAGYLSFRLIACAYRWARGRDGIGQGDAKLLAAAGAWVGWAALGDVVLLGALASIAIAILRGGGLTRQTAVPFGPGLAIAMLAVRLYG